MTKSRFDDDVRGRPYLAGFLGDTKTSRAEALFRRAELPIADFYKQLAFEIDQGHLRDLGDALEGG